MRLLNFTRLIPVLLLAPLATHAAELYSGTAITQGSGGKFEDPIALKIRGKKLTGILYSNALGRPVPFSSPITASGRFRARIATETGIEGRLAGKLRNGAIRTKGRLHSETRGPATFTADAKFQANPSPRGELPDLSGTRRLPLIHYGTPESYRSINFTLVKETSNYSYRAVFADAPSRTDKVDARVDFPSGDSLSFSNDFSYTYAVILKVTIDFDVSIDPVGYDPGVYNFSFVLHYTSGGDHGIAFGHYQAFFRL